jgi:hypothetical protein
MLSPLVAELLSIYVRGTFDCRVSAVVAGDDGGAAAIALLDDFEEVVAGRSGENLQTKIVEDEHIGAGQRPEKPGMAAVAAGSVT